MKRARLIYNPTSGREEMRRILPDVLERLDRHGIETSCHATTGAGTLRAKLPRRSNADTISS